MSIRLVLADDHTLFRDALVQFIERAEPDSRVTVAKDMQEVIGVMQEHPVQDMVLLDLRMPGMDGLRGLEKLRSAYPGVPVVLLSGLAEKRDVEQAMSLGASGFFPKTMSGQALLGGIHKVLDGEIFVPLDHNTNEIMPSYYNGTHGYGGCGMSDRGQAAYDAGPESRLTPREKEVLSYLVHGASNKEIAAALDVQIVTVKLHVRGICRKLCAKNRTQAALKAQQRGLVP